MCCLFTTLLLIGPRAAIVLWWLVQPLRWSTAFDSFIVPFLGLLFLPWTTLMYVLVSPGGVEGFDFLWLLIALLGDLAQWFGGAWGNRGRIESTYSSYSSRWPY
jgi:hypothetical protein